MQTNGNPCTKFVVPSTGSITQVGLSVKFTFFDSLALTVSSPTKEKEGYISFNLEKRNCSTFLSTAVTKSVGLESLSSVEEFIISRESNASFTFSPAFNTNSFVFSKIYSNCNSIFF